MTSRFTDWLLAQEIGFDQLRDYVQDQGASLRAKGVAAVRGAIDAAGLPEPEREALRAELSGADLAHRSVRAAAGSWWAGFGAFVGILALLVVAAVLIYRGAHPELVQLLARPEMARGLITSVFALSVVAIATVIVAANFLSVASDLKERVGQGREVMLALVGILGTIVGYYFAAGQGTTPLSVSSPQVVPAPPTSGQPATVVFAIAGGATPFTWVLDATVAGEAADARQDLDKTAQAANSGVVLVPGTWPADNEEAVTLTVTVIDGTGTRVTAPSLTVPAAEP